MNDKEKILRWNLKESTDKLNSDIGEVPFVHMAFVIKQERLKEVEKSKKDLEEHLKIK